MKILSEWIGAGLVWRERGRHQWAEMTFTGIVVGKWFFGICHDLDKDEP